MKFPKLIPCLVILSVISFTQGQTMLNFKVIGPLGNAVSDINISFEDAGKCIIMKTNKDGKLQIEVDKIPDIIFLSDSRNFPIYGAKSYIINESKIEYDIHIPFYPRDMIEAGAQADEVLNNFSTAYGYYSAADFISKIGTGASTIHGAGVPGIFSINPIPVVDDQGKLGFNISGVLAEFLARFYDKLVGAKFNYHYDPRKGL